MKSPWVLSQCVEEGESSKRKALYSLHQIRDIITQGRGRLADLQVEYVLQGRNPEGERVEPLTSHHVFAARGPFRFEETTHASTLIPYELDVNQNLVFLTEDSLTIFYPLTRYCETSERHAHTHYAWEVKAPVYLECLGWWPPDDKTKLPEEDSPLFLSKALAKEGWRILPHQVRIDNIWCYVLERPGVDKLWLDPSIGFALRRRERYSGRPAVTFAHYELSDYREAAPGIFLPWMLRRRVFNPRLISKDGLPSMTFESVCRVIRTEVNHVQPQLFRFTPPPGTLIKDLDTLKVTQTPGGLEWLDALVETARALFAIYATRGLGGAQPQESLAWQGYALVGAALALVALNAQGLWKAFAPKGSSDN
jgi:hypothetical protein